MRSEVSPLPNELIEVSKIIVRGNQQQYFVHLKTRGSLIPWQFYQSGFKVTDQWQEIHLPLCEFAPRTTGRQLILDSLAKLKPARDSDKRMPLRVLELTAKEKLCKYPDRACHGDSSPL